MNYRDLLEAHLKYGTKEEDIINTKEYGRILENVVLAPAWEHTIFDNYNFEVEMINNKIYNLSGDKISFTYIELNSIGAPVLMDEVLSLGVSKCKNIIFLGSAGSLDENIKIGDIIVPEYSICGDGASRYLNKNLEDEFMKKEYPSKDLTDELLKVLDSNNIKYHYVPNYSVDTVFAQYYHLDKIIDTGAKTIEMETASVFKCGKLLNINITALFRITDNSVVNKTLYQGITSEELEYRHIIKYEVIPKVVIELLEKLS